MISKVGQKWSSHIKLLATFGSCRERLILNQKVSHRQFQNLKLLYCMNVTCESFFLSCFAIIIGLGRPKCLAYWDFHETFFQFHHFLKLKIVKSIFYYVGTLQKTAQP